MPRTEEQLERIREESREKILKTGLTLFARHGYERTSIRMIAEEAGISQGLMYNYYSGKTDLLRAIFAEGMAAVRGEFGVQPAALSPADRLEWVIRSSLAVVASNLELWRLTYAVRMQPGILQNSAEEIRGWTETLRREIEGALRSAGVANIGAEMAVLFALIDGVAQHQVMAPRRYPIQEVTEAIVERYRTLAS